MQAEGERKVVLVETNVASHEYTTTLHTDQSQRELFPQS